MYFDKNEYSEVLIYNDMLDIDESTQVDVLTTSLSEITATSKRNYEDLPLIEEMNNELEKTYKYMTANTLLINKNKSQFILFKPKGNKKTEITKKLMIRDTEIQRVESARYLGVWIDEKLKFDKTMAKNDKKQSLFKAEQKRGDIRTAMYQMAVWNVPDA